jgi:predicted outer membrane protein
MRLSRAILAAMVALVLVAPATAQDSDGMTPAIAQCLRDNAASVEAAEPDLTKATDYLVGNACAQPVAAEQQRLTNLRLKALADRNRQRCEERVARQKKVDGENNRTSANRYYENCADQADTLLGARLYGGTAVGIRPASVVSMAAKLILNLRVAHSKSRP